MDYYFHSLSPLVCDNLRPLTLSLPVKVGFRFPPLYSLSPTASEVHWCFCYLSFLVHHCLTRFPPLITFRFHHTHFLSLLFQMHVCCCLYHVYTLLCFSTLFFSASTFFQELSPCEKRVKEGQARLSLS